MPGDEPASAGPSSPIARILSAATVYTRFRILAFLALGFSSGLPLALTAGTLSIRLTEVGIDLTTIGLFVAVGSPYSLKFLWAPIIDRAPFPGLTGVFGRRRGWLLAAQFALMASLIALGLADPVAEVVMTASLALTVAFFSATQDIVIDAYRIERLPERELGAGAAMYVFGYRVGMLASGAGALFLATWLPWSTVYVIMAGLILIGVVTVLVSPEPAAAGAEQPMEQGSGVTAALDWLKTAVVMPFAEFMGRRGWIVILLFVTLYKFGDTLAGTMTNPFLIKIGFTKAEIAEIAKVYGFAATLIGLAAGGALINGIGLIRALWVCGILQLLSNLMFAVQAAAGADLGLLAATIGFENLAGGMGTAAFVAYLSSLCNVAFTATQYALLSSLMAVARTWLSAPAGWLVEHVDWAAIASHVPGVALAPDTGLAVNWIGFFLLTTVAALPGLGLLIWVQAITRRQRREMLSSAPAA
ncbi:MAG: MFS transporter [Rhodospirillaceae bacterium]|nr:MFS transporter [Rhodospirillaceae bacterium]